MIYILHLETSTKACSVALSCDGVFTTCKEVLSEDFSHSENLTLFIDEVLTKANISIKDLSAVSVASGPGSYTGLRIGVSTAKGLCYALDIPLISIDSLSSLENCARKKYLNENILVMFDARRKEVYSAIFNAKSEIIKPISADILDENTYEIFEPIVAVGDGIAKMEDEWSGRNIVFDASFNPSAIGQVEIAYQKYLNKQFEDTAYFEPFYLKDFLITNKSI